MKTTPEAKAAQRAISEVGLNKTGNPENGAVELAKILHLTRQRIYQFAQSGIPMGYVLQVEAASGISREELCPKMFARANGKERPE